MKNIKHILFSGLIIITFFMACKKEPDDLGLRSKYGVYTTMTPTPLDAATVAVTGSGSQSIADVSFRTYVNMLYNKPVTVKFRLTGTAVLGTHYNYVGDSTLTIPANKRYVDVPIKVVPGSLGTGANRTVIFTLISVSDNFTIGIGSNLGSTRSTYTITKP